MQKIGTSVTVSQRNPFTPTFGKVPPFLVGRDEILRDLGGALENGSGDPNLSTILIGARGSGKTALLSSVADEALEHGWVTAEVTASKGMLDDILERAEDAATAFLRRDPETRVTGIGVGGLFSIDMDRQPVKQGNWRTRMNRLLDQLEEHDVGLVISVDEVIVDLDEMITLASTYQHFVRENRRVALVMAGLPHNVTALLSDKSVSFLRRCRQRHLTRLTDSDVQNALVKTFALGNKEVEEDARASMVEAIDGFPYMLQLVGYYVYATAMEEKVGQESAARGIEQAEHEFSSGVLAQTYRELSAGDIRFLLAMLEDDDVSKLSDVARRMGVKSNYASQYKARLLSAGVIGERGRGYVGFDLPGMRTFLMTRT